MSVFIIKPIINTTTVTIEYILCNVSDVVLGQSATIITQFFTASGALVKSERDIMSGQDYLNWGSDDKYIYYWICDKYGLVRQ